MKGFTQICEKIMLSFLNNVFWIKKEVLSDFVWKWWRVRDSNPWMHAWKACELTVSPTSHMALEVGLEPTTDRLTADCSTNWAIQAYSIKWSGWWESNPRSQLGRLKFYHWTTPALNGAQGRSRTGTDFKVRRILSPVRLPISPPGLIQLNGDPQATRTPDPLIKSQMLYQLS